MQKANWVPKKPKMIRLPKWLSLSNGDSVHAYRFVFLLVYHAFHTKRIQCSWKEMAALIGLKNTDLVYDPEWWMALFESVWTLNYQFLFDENESLLIFPSFAMMKIDPQFRTVSIEMSETFCEAVRKRGELFNAVHYDEVLNLTGTKLIRAYVLFCSIERLNSAFCRTFTLGRLDELVSLPGPPRLQIKELKRLALGVQKATNLKVQVLTKKSGRCVSGVELKVKRRLRPKPYLKLSKRGL